jgi:antitoxin ChpS
MRRDILKISWLAAGQVEPQQKPRYTLEELLAQCNPKVPRSNEEREWLGARPAGGELVFE